MTFPKTSICLLVLSATTFASPLSTNTHSPLCQQPQNLWSSPSMTELTPGIINIDGATTTFKLATVTNGDMTMVPTITQGPSSYWLGNKDVRFGGEDGGAEERNVQCGFISWFVAIDG
ncbi:hypothetical protein BT63DRAFT_437071 [Microthyrium microscopicum]|uniref:Uncharacterized protein n=1 Tax=Microthyrium microscopicum TaxID=703497 RepID=A0A6A6UQI2_9PEZI|nr:hypothetical protein BT63DRAFT_437071 [Microthyrium microscopicum]